VGASIPRSEVAKPISDVAKKKIDAAVAGYPERWLTGVCAFQLIDRDTGELSDHSDTTSGPCHGGVNSAQETEILVNAHSPKKQGAYPEFSLWVARESPFAHGVLNKANDDEILRHAGVIDVEIVGKGGALWLCKAWRTTVEVPFKVKMWETLRKQGLNDFQAFIGATILLDTGQPQRTLGHSDLFAYVSPQKLRQYHDEILSVKKIPTSAAARYNWQEDYTYKDTWGSMGYKTEKKPDGWGGFTEKKVPCDAKEYAAKLKEIFEGDPNNVS
jgi:hypothetical protein